MLPHEFQALTPREFLWRVEGYERREETVTYRLAWLMANLLQPHAKAGKTLRPEMFLSGPLKHIKAPVSPYPATAFDRAMAGAFST